MSSTYVSGFGKSFNELIASYINSIFSSGIWLGLWRPDTVVGVGNLSKAAFISPSNTTEWINFLQAGEIIYSNVPSDERIKIDEKFTFDETNMQIKNNQVIEIPVSSEKVYGNIGGFALFTISSEDGDTSKFHSTTSDILAWSYLRSPIFIGVGDTMQFSQDSIILEINPRIL